MSLGPTCFGKEFLRGSHWSPESGVTPRPHRVCSLQTLYPTAQLGPRMLWTRGSSMPCTNLSMCPASVCPICPLRPRPATHLCLTPCFPVHTLRILSQEMDSGSLWPDHTARTLKDSIILCCPSRAPGKGLNGMEETQRHAGTHPGHTTLMGGQSVILFL